MGWTCRVKSLLNYMMDNTVPLYFHAILARLLVKIAWERALKERRM